MQSNAEKRTQCRVPTMEQLLSLLWFIPGTKPDPVLEIYLKEAIPSLININESWIWSRTPPYAYVSFRRGEPSRATARFKGNVLLMRETNQPGTWQYGDDVHARYTISPCGTFVLDRLSGLEWKRHIEPGSYTFDEVVALDQNLRDNVPAYQKPSWAYYMAWLHDRTVWSDSVDYAYTDAPEKKHKLDRMEMYQMREISRASIVFLR